MISCGEIYIRISNIIKDSMWLNKEQIGNQVGTWHVKRSHTHPPYFLWLLVTVFLSWTFHLSVYNLANGTWKSDWLISTTCSEAGNELEEKICMKLLDILQMSSCLLQTLMLLKQKEGPQIGEMGWCLRIRFGSGMQMLAT